MYVGTRVRDTRAGLHQSLPHLSLFLSFWSYYSWSRWQQIKFPARARKNRRPELNWKQLEWGLWIEKGRKRKRPSVQLRCLQPHGFLAGASQLHYFAPWMSCIQSFSDFGFQRNSIKVEKTLGKFNRLCLFINEALNMIYWVGMFLFFDSPLGRNWPLHNSTRERMSTDRHLAAVCTRCFFYKNYKNNFIHNQNSANKETRFAINNTGFNVLFLIKKKIPRCHWASCFCRLINHNKKNCEVYYRNDGV